MRKSRSKREEKCQSQWTHLDISILVLKDMEKEECLSLGSTARVYGTLGWSGWHVRHSERSVLGLELESAGEDYELE
jgi:hypothetical protein